MKISKDGIDAANLLSFAEYKEKKGWGENLTYDSYLAKSTATKFYDVANGPWDGERFCATVPNQTLSYQCRDDGGALNWVRIGNDRLIVWDADAKAYQIQSGRRSTISFPTHQQPAT